MRYTFKIPLYDCKIELHIEENISLKFKQLCKKLDGFVPNYDVDGAVVSLSLDKYYLCLDKNKLSHNLISHELYHLTVAILEDRDIQDEETGAWLSGYLSSVVYRYIDKKSLSVKYG